MNEILAGRYMHSNKRKFYHVMGVAESASPVEGDEPLLVATHTESLLPVRILKRSGKFIFDGHYPDKSPLVLSQCEKTLKYWVRPKDMFLDEVLVGNKLMPRFVRIPDSQCLRADKVDVIS